MKIDGSLIVTRLEETGALARRLEALGFDGAYTYEGQHDPFLPLVLAGRETERLTLSTAIAVAFARTPMLLANIGWDLQAMTGGRFVLGLGSQIRPHIENRFGMPWSRPAARMRELVLAIRAIWSCWSEGTPLDFRGSFSRHTLMTPIFSPGPNPHGDARIFVAGVGPRMTEVAGEVGDGFIAHPFHTPEFLRDTTLPALERGLARAGRRREEFEFAWQVMVVCGRDDAALASALRATRAQIAFYASTPAYRPVLASRGWQDLQPELRRLSKSGRWEEMAALVSDEIVDAIAVRGRPAEVARKLRERGAGFADRVAIAAPYLADPELLAEVAGELREAP